MRLEDFVEERQDESECWAELFEKYDCVFIVSGEEFPELYEQFKKEFADHLFDLRYGYQHLDEQIDEYYDIMLEEDAGEYATLLKSFLQLEDRPSYLAQPDRFLDALEKYAEAEEKDLRVDLGDYLYHTKRLLDRLCIEIRQHFVSLEDPAKEFAQMTSQVGEALADLVFSQLRRCTFTRAKTNLDNPNMPRHGEDLLAFFFGEAPSGDEDQLYFVEAKSTKGYVGEGAREIRDRFKDHLQEFPAYEITRLKREVSNKVEPRQVTSIRKRITRLVLKTEYTPEDSQLRFSGFLHYRDEYNPRKTTLSILGEIGVDPCRMHLIVFKFPDFENTVREIFERAWTI